MQNEVAKTTILKGGFHRKVKLIELSDGQKFILKGFPTDSSEDKNEEWNTLVYLHNRGYSVPMPIDETNAEIIMQYIENGVIWDFYVDADATIKKEIIAKYAKLIYDLHKLEVSNADNSFSGYFIKEELAKIRCFINELQLDNYLKAFNWLDSESVNISQQPLCYIHGDYSPWNVLYDNAYKFYAIDMILHQGDYRYDIAWSYMNIMRAAKFVKDTGVVEFAEDFLAEYAKLNSEILVDFEYFKQLSTLRWLTHTKRYPEFYMKEKRDEKTGIIIPAQKLVEEAERYLCCGARE